MTERPPSRQADNRRPTHSLDSRCTVQGCPECDHAPCPIPTPPGYEPCWKGRGHSGLHDFRRMDAPARSRVLTLPCSSCGRSRTECRTVDEPFLSCCRACAADDGDTHRPTPPGGSPTGGSTPEPDSATATSAPYPPSTNAGE